MESADFNFDIMLLNGGALDKSALWFSRVIRGDCFKSLAFVDLGF
jgi:hypothetical protein